MDNEADIRLALAEVVQGDTSTGGLVALTGSSRPMVRYGDKGSNARPIITYFVPTSRRRMGTKDALVLGVQFDIWVEANSTGTENKIADRLETLITHSNLNSTVRTNAVDVAPYWGPRRELPELDVGRKRLTVYCFFWFNRSLG